MIRVLSFRNPQRTRSLNIPLLRRVTRHLLEEELENNYELGIHLVDAREMARVNWQFLQHRGSTDVITFDHGAEKSPGCLHGEIFVSIPDAVKQSRELGTTWQSEVVRYIIHGLLHLCGHDDLQSRKRRAMKREENRLHRRMEILFPLQRIARSQRASTLRR
ncbi:MAG TPA: rRNA maturation RNase YbeY [Verrucomicrobiae bacterium]|jgi:probable rRNA maturation factor